MLPLVGGDRPPTESAGAVRIRYTGQMAVSAGRADAEGRNISHGLSCVLLPFCGDDLGRSRLRIVHRESDRARARVLVCSRPEVCFALTFNRHITKEVKRFTAIRLSILFDSIRDDKLFPWCIRHQPARWRQMIFRSCHLLDPCCHHLLLTHHRTFRQKIQSLLA